MRWENRAQTSKMVAQQYLNAVESAKKRNVISKRKKYKSKTISLSKNRPLSIQNQQKDG